MVNFTQEQFNKLSFEERVEFRQRSAYTILENPIGEAIMMLALCYILLTFFLSLHAFRAVIATLVVMTISYMILCINFYFRVKFNKELFDATYKKIIEIELKEKIKNEKRK